MKRVIWIAIIICASVFFVAYLLLNKNKSTLNNSSKEVLVASVNAVPIQLRALSRDIVAYGIIESKPGTAKTITLNFDATINKMYVIDGQSINKDQLLFSVIPSPATQSQLMQAENSVKLSQENLKITQEKFKLHLLTQQDILNAQNALNQAEIVYENLKKVYTDKVYSPTNGVITKINYTEGANVVAGSPILSVANTNNIAVKCGVEPEDVNFLKLGMPVTIFLIDYNKNITGKIVSISNIIDPATHLINVYISPDANESLLLNSYVEVSIPVSKSTGFSVPKLALLYENGHYIIYTIKNGTAKKHIVNVVLKNQNYALITSSEITDKDLVVTQGAYELKNNMRVKVQK
ncbi:putative Co/Zn/Cd efflux system membrane fusion protein [Desulfurella amilsii]|uniref:Putative Co/Zn/Cd efflux system membrane fusion protein n=1 Tax=Desulfurella amilsii TaxID=1562698 RepID=A0A1X4XZI6_9BACT|nr:efflux RND transporter periplasmic adaptor subunit [Desulfurella amilsii]OSS42940.1 putative Co/Zn/Cd efflux system membrane fusion protein [Desulfurella amilsii]